MAHEEQTPSPAANATGAAKVEINLLEYAEQGKDVPQAHAYQVRVDGREVVVETPTPSGDELLHMAGKRSCAYELIEEFVHHKNNVVEPSQKVDLRKKGLKGFITAHKEVVTVFINENPCQLERGKRSVLEILAKVGESPDEHILLEEKDGRTVLLDAHVPVTIQGCENFKSRSPFDIQIDRVHYMVTLERLSGLQLRHLPNPPIGPDRDLFEVVSGGSDLKISDEQMVEMRDCLRFFSAPSHINPG